MQKLSLLFATAIAFAVTVGVLYWFNGHADQQNQAVAAPPITPAVVTDESSPIRAVADREMPPGFDPQRHMAVEEVRIGMQGYTLSVVQGVEPTAFPVEVIAVEYTGRFARTAGIWVRGLDERSELYGPVSGMSGSPVFLWPAGDKRIEDGGTRTVGEGGRMIGAYAYGYNFSEEANIGVTPIEEMLEAAARAEAPIDEETVAQRYKAMHRGRTLATAMPMVQQLAEQQPNNPVVTRLRYLAAANGIIPGPDGKNIAERYAPQQYWNSASYRHALAQVASQTSRTASDVQPLSIPVMVRGQEYAEMLQPFLRPLGMTAMNNAMAGGKLPPWYSEQLDDHRWEPGGVLAVPFVIGDNDLPAIGTVTEVLPDGTVLGFGHANFGVGDVMLPVGTGFNHFVAASTQNSFKVGGTLQIRGAMINDETTAVVVRPDLIPDMVPATVHVDWPKESMDKTFNYQMTHYAPMLGPIVGYLAGSSAVTDSGFPLNNTVTIESVFRFEDGRTLETTTMMPFADTRSISFDQMGPASLVDNPYTPIRMIGYEATVTVEDEARVTQLISATMVTPEVEPGEDIRVVLTLLDYQDQQYQKVMRITVPDDLPAGAYPVLVGGLDLYLDQLYRFQEHLFRVEKLDDMFELIHMIYQQRQDVLYGILLRNEAGIALGRQAMPSIPSSRGTMLINENTNRATLYRQMVVEQMPTRGMGTGFASLTVNVVDPATP